MADGHLNKCKPCCRTDSVKNRVRNLDYYLKYDRSRSQLEKRVNARKAFQLKTRKLEPLKHAARSAISNGIRDGKLKRRPCSVCGIYKSDAHHTDYSKPLDVIWLCRKHHMEHHRKHPHLYATPH